MYNPLRVGVRVIFLVYAYYSCICVGVDVLRAHVCVCVCLCTRARVDAHTVFEPFNEAFGVILVFRKVIVVLHLKGLYGAAMTGGVFSLETHKSSPSSRLAFRSLKKKKSTRMQNDRGKKSFCCVKNRTWGHLPITLC